MNQTLRKKARLTSFLRKALKPLFAVCALAPVFGAPSAWAQLTWEGNDGLGGNGSWNLTPGNTVWSTNGLPPGTTAWTNPNTATFSGSDNTATVTITGSSTVINPTAITFTTSGYTITDDGSGAKLQLDNGTSATAATITVNATKTATITTALHSGFNADTLTINGGGTLIINGYNKATYLGATIIIDGNTTVQAAVNALHGTGNFAIPQASAIVIGDGAGTGKLDLNGTSQTILSLAGGTNGTVTNANTGAYSNLAAGAGNNGGFTTFAGQITDTATSVETTNNLTPNGGLGLTVGGTTNTGGYTLILSGMTNNYHGMTVVENGVVGAMLQAGGTDAFSANSAVNVNGGAALDINGFSQTIAALDGTGTGTVTNNGAASPATLTLNGDGGTDTLKSSADVVDGATSTVALTKDGTYTQVLAGNNTYSGATTVNTGTLANGSTTGFSPNSAYTIGTGSFLDLNGFNASLGALSGSGNLTNGSGNVTGPTSGNATVSIGSLNTLQTTFTGKISDGTSGTLALTKVGTGTLLLSGTNSYSGATTVNHGTLAMGATTAFAGSSAYTINTPGILDLNGFSGSIASLAGNGTVVNGSGNVTSPGTGNATLTAGNNTSTTYSGALNDGASGTLGLTKVGTGTLTLSGASSTYSGGTILQAGTLVIANSGATTGPLGKGNVTVNGGFLQSGGTNTNIQVGKNYNQGSGGELDLRIGGTAAGAYDQLSVAGSATLAGKLGVSAVNGFVPKNGEVIPIVTAGGGVSGQFATVTGTLANFPMVKLTVAYLPNAVDLDFSQGSFMAAATMLRQTLTPNERAIASTLDHLAPNAASTKLLGSLDALPFTSLPGAYHLIAPAEYGAVYEISRSSAKIEAASIENRLDEVHAGAPAGGAVPTGANGPAGPEDYKGSKEVMPPPDKRLSVYANGSGEFVNVGDSYNAKGYNFDSGAATVGVDYLFTDHFLAGVLLNYTGTEADLTGGGRIDANAFRGGVYASLFGGGAYVNAFAGGAYSSYNVDRQGLNSTVRGNTDGSDFNGLVTTGYDVHAGGFTYGPVASFQYTYTGLNGFNETGSLAPLHIQSGHGDSILSNVGARAAYDWHIGNMVLVPEIRATWQHEYGDDSDAITAEMLLGSPVFRVTSAPIGRDSLVLNAGFTLKITADISAYAFYDGELARTNYQANNVMVGFRTSF